MHSLVDYDALLRDRARERVENERAHLVAIRRRERAAARAVLARRLDRALRALDTTPSTIDRTGALASGAQDEQPAGARPADELSPV